MTVSRPDRLGTGDEVRVEGVTHVVAGLSGGMVHLVDAAGTKSVMRLAELFRAPGTAVVASPRKAPLPPQGLLAGVPASRVERARWWEQHIIEVLTGVLPEAAPGTVPRPGFDPHASTLRQREMAKVAELGALGHEIPLSTFQRLRHSYEQEGLWGLVDGRATRQPSPGGLADKRIADAVRRAVAEQTDQSTGTVGRVRRRVEKILAAEYGANAPPMPSRATFYRLVERVSHGTHAFGSARTRRSLAKQPDGPFGTVRATRPGEWVQIDSTPLDVRVVLDDGLPDRVELTWMIDLASGTIPAAVLSPTTKAVDAALLLARALTPEPMRPGWADALRMSRSILPHRRLTDIDARMERAAARPVIVPETIVCDHGKVYVSQTFRAACRAMGINFQAAHKGSPWEKGAVERSFGSVGTLFAQHAAGYVGSSVERRGRHAEQAAAWPMTELQDLLDEWIVACWQNRQHDGLRDPLVPGQALTPNEKYAALVEVAGYVPVPLPETDYIELMAVTWRAINSYGIKIRRRTYDCKALNPYRRQPSGVKAQRDRWEVHYDPYDVSRIWVRNQHDSGWITVPWTHLRTAPVPFGEMAWEHARKIISRQGAGQATEEEIAQVVDDLLDRAGQGPAEAAQPSKAARRVAGRTRATAKRPAPDPEPVPQAAAAADPAPDDEGADDVALAPVIPLGVFDAEEEAKRWW
jgi:transposase InsO family protein